MTDFDAATAWQSMRAATAALCIAVAGLGLGGCETSSSLFGSNPFSGNPFGGGGASAEATSAPRAQPAAPQMVAKVALAPIVGAPEPLAQQLRTQVVQSAEKSRVGILADRDPAGDFSMRGYLVAARDKAGVKVSYIWDITDPSGKRVNRITGEEVAAAVPGAKDPWGSVTPTVTQAIADKVGSSLGTWAPTQPGVASAGPAVAAADTAPAGASVAASGVTNATTASLQTTPAAPVVTGAPGDGNEALASALQKELSRQGASLGGQQGSPHRVEGKVTVGAVADGKQPIQIDWKVVDAQGKAVGTVTQKNSIPPGSLDGSWGKTADAAAAAAAQGIIKLLPQRSAAAGATN